MLNHLDPLKTKPTNTSATGFTLLELMMTLATLAILAGLFLPAVTQVQRGAQDRQCINNSRQLLLALHLYAAEHQELLPPNEDNNTQLDGWVAGDMTQPNQATNTLFLTDPRYAKLAKYTAPDASLYRCPADQSTVSFGSLSVVSSQSSDTSFRTPHSAFRTSSSVVSGQSSPVRSPSSVVSSPSFARVRSVSMNQAVGTKRDGKSPVDGSWLNGGLYGNNSARIGPYRTYGRLSAMTQPAPDQLWVFIDEDEYSINDAGFAVTLHSQPTTAEWIDRPATSHQMGCGVAFADGHAEIHRWQDPRTPVQPGHSLRATHPHSPDLLWLTSRTTARK